MTFWYVRPNATHSAVRDGKSYATAWGGWSEIVWGSLGVAGGDTLIVCGAHTYSANIVIGLHGGVSALTLCTITGVYASDPGSITFIGASFMVNNRPWTNVSDLPIVAGTSNCIYAMAGATNSAYLNNSMIGNGAPCLALSTANGDNHADILIESNDFSGSANNGAILWLPTGTNQTSLTRVSIIGNTFHDLTVARAAVHLRTDSTVPTTVRMQDIVVENNDFIRLNGKPIEVTDGQVTSKNSAGVRILNNTEQDCLTTLDGSMGGNSVQGFAHSKTPGFGLNTIYGNIAKNISGPNGFFNVFSGEYLVYGNECDGVSTQTIDGNGILVDIDNDGVYIFANRIKNCIGKTGVSNSGCGIMVLNSINIHAFGNIIEGCRVGVWLSQANGATQQADIFNNTVLNSTIYGIFIGQYASRAALRLMNNIFSNNDPTVPYVYDQVTGGWAGEDHNCVIGFAASANHTEGVNNLHTDPLLELPTYTPAANSPCIGAGAFLDPTLTDFFNRRFARNPTIGAIERNPTAMLRR